MLRQQSTDKFTEKHTNSLNLESKFMHTHACTLQANIGTGMPEYCLDTTYQQVGLLKLYDIVHVPITVIVLHFEKLRHHGTKFGFHSNNCDANIGGAKKELQTEQPFTWKGAL